MKQCTKCGCVKPCERFYALSKPGTYTAQCKKCRDWNSPQAVLRQAKRRMARPDVRARELEKERQKRAAVKAANEPLRRAVEQARASRDPNSAAARYLKRYKSDPEFALKERIRAANKRKAKLYPRLETNLRDAVRRGGSSPVTERILGYSMRQLREHLERQFTKGMSWQAFHEGRIHIDHITPQCRFNLADEDEYRACWALPNLRPAWAADNLAKGAALVSLL